MSKKKKDEDPLWVGEKVKVAEDFASRLQASEYVRSLLEELGKNKGSHGTFFVEGPTVSDLFIVEPSKRKKDVIPSIRPCTDEEWADYFWNTLSGKDRKDESAGLSMSK